MDNLDSRTRKSYNIPEMKLIVERRHTSQRDSSTSYEEDENDLMQVNERLELQSSLINAASRRVEQYKKEGSFLFSASAVSERSSVPSTYFNETSVPESIDGGFSEVDELKSLHTSYESCLKICQALSRRMANTLSKLEEALKNNKERQQSLEVRENTVSALRNAGSAFDPRARVMIRTALFSVPYFKDRFGTSAPMNEETEKKIMNDYLDLYTTKSRVWLTSERATLQKAIVDDYKTGIVKNWSINKKIAEKKLSAIENDSDAEEELLDVIDDCKTHLQFFKSVSTEKLQVPKDANIDWSKIAAQEFDGDRTPEECNLQWVNYLHPNINKEDWSEVEDITIRRQVSETSGKPKWIEIAEKLRTGRTPLQVMQRYVSFIKPALEPIHWSRAHSDKLMETINTLRVGNYIPWNQISQHLLGYTPTQIKTRWHILNPDIVRGKFTREEDYTLVKGLFMFGLNWNLIIHYLPGRQKIQAKNRFKKAILPGLTYNPWKAKEDKKILENCSSSSQHWRKMSSMLRKRDACEVRLRFYILQFWQNMSGRKVMPPPLYPLSESLNTAEINKMKKLLNHFNTRFSIIIDKSLIKGNCHKFRKSPASPEHEVEPAVEEAEVVARIPRKSILKRNIGYSRRVPTWPNRALVEFFLPSRTYEMKGAHDPMDHKAAEVALSLSQIFQMNIKSKVTSEEEEKLELLGYTRQDIVSVNSIVSDSLENMVPPNSAVIKWSYRSASKGSCGDLIGLIPPNSVTVGAFRSLLLHKEKLKEMSTKCFLFHRVPPPLFFKLGTKEKDLSTVLANKEIDSDYDEELVVIHEEDNVPPSTTKRSRRTRAAASKAKRVNAAMFKSQPSLAHVVANQNLLTGSMPTGLGRERITDESSQQDIIMKEDKLLFHRMMAAFFWPMQFTREPAPENAKLAAETKLNELIYMCEEGYEASDDENVTISEDKPKPKFTGKLGYLDIKEHESLIKLLDCRRLTNLIPKKRQEDSKEMINFIVNSHGESDEERTSKKEIISMKRSLVVKKLWDDRRKGLKPQRRPRFTAGLSQISVEGGRKSERISKRRKLH